MYTASVPVFVKMLGNLSELLKKGQEFAATSGVSEDTLTTAKLAEDMFPLTRQIQIATDAAKGVSARLAGVDVPSFDDSEQTFEELQARIAKTVSFLQSLSAEQLDGTETKAIEFATKGGSYNFTGQDYLFTFAMPNFYFHVTTAYDILRHKGVQLGKNDYLGRN